MEEGCPSAWDGERPNMHLGALPEPSPVSFEAAYQPRSQEPERALGHGVLFIFRLLIF